MKRSDCFIRARKLALALAVLGSVAAGCRVNHPELGFAEAGGGAPGPVASINGLPLRYDFIEDNAYNRYYKIPGPFADVETVTIHNTAEPLSARQERDRVDHRRDRMSVSFHFAVDEREAVQLLPLNRHAWHAGDGGKGPGNTRSIGIEICRSQCYGDDDALYRRAEANAVLLAAWLLDTYNLPLDALKKHQDWSGKNCPHRILVEKRWADFRRRVGAAMRSRQKREAGYDDATLGMAVFLESHQGRNVCKTSAGTIFPTVAELIADLQKNGVGTVDVSSWLEGVSQAEQRRLYLEPLRAGGIQVRSFYAYAPGASVYDRENLVSSDRDPAAYRAYTGTHFIQKDND